MTGSWFRRKAHGDALPTHMQPADVLAIARAILVDEPSFIVDTLSPPKTTDMDGRIVWTTSTMVVDSSVTITVADADGQVLAVKRHHRPESH